MFGKGLFLWGVVLVLGAQAVQAGFYYEQEVYTPASGGQPPRTTTIVGFIAGPKVRAEDRSAKTPNVIITRLDQGVIRLLVPSDRAYIEMPVPGMNEEQAQPFPVTVTQSNQTRKIGPYPCTRFDVRTDGQTLSLWLSTDIELPSEDVSTYWQAGTRLYPVTLTRQLTKLPGFPVRVEVMSQGAAVVTTVTTVAKQEVPAFLFEVPFGYQRGLTIQAPPEPEGPKAPPRSQTSPPPPQGGPKAPEGSQTPQGPRP